MGDSIIGYLIILIVGWYILSKVKPRIFTAFLNDSLKKYRGVIVVILIILLTILDNIAFKDHKDTPSQPAVAVSSDTAADNKEEKQQAQLADKIKEICKDQLGSKLISVDINDDMGNNDGTKIVIVHLKGNEGISNKGTRTIMVQQVRDLMEKLYTSGYPISKVDTFSEATLVDKYGKESQAPVMKCTLKSDTAAKIKWENKGSIDFTQIFDYYWTAPALRGN